MFNILATAVVLAAALAVLGGVALMIRLSLQDKEQSGMLKDLMDILAGGSRSAREADETPAPSAPPAGEPFEEACPACGAAVTHEHVHCPSCGLRLQ